MGIFKAAPPRVPPAVQVIAAPKLIPTGWVARDAPVAAPALLKFKIVPPVVTKAEV